VTHDMLLWWAKKGGNLQKSVSVHGPQKHSEKLSRTVQTTNTIVAKLNLVVNSLAL